jgi:hypothetical protein
MSVYNKIISGQLPYIKALMQLEDVEDISSDDSYKLPKMVLKHEGESIFTQSTVVMNSFNCVRSLVLTSSKEGAVKEQILTSIRDTGEQLGMPPTRSIYIDNIKGEGALYKKVFPGLERRSMASDVIVSVDAVDLPFTAEGRPNWVHLTHGSAMNNFVEADLVQFVRQTALTDGTRHVFALDTETTENGKLCVIQITRADGRTIVFDIAEVNYKVPAALKTFLSRADVDFVGSNISYDARILGYSGIILPNPIDINSVAARLHYISVAQIALDDLCAKMLGKRIPDKVVHQRSDWTGKKTERQIEYAVRDSYSVMLIYQKLLSSPPNLPPLSKAKELQVVRQLVDIYTKSGTIKVARGEIHRVDKGPPSMSAHAN